MDIQFADTLEASLTETVRQCVDRSVSAVVEAKRAGGEVFVVTGSGPNLHEGVTTLIAELIRLGVVDGVSTSSAVVAHEMAGVLDRVKRVHGSALDLDPGFLPQDGSWELSLVSDSQLELIESVLPLDRELIAQTRRAHGDEVIKAAGNLGYPMGLWIETLAAEVLKMARQLGTTFEDVAGFGADPRTMLGAGCARQVPVIVSVPQLVGGGQVGICIGDSITIRDRSSRLAEKLGSAKIIIESAVALTQEIHDGPFETYTGHGLWASWLGHPTYSLEGKTLIRVDLDRNLELISQAERTDRRVQEAIDRGLPKTKVLGVPFRMEMSGFARLEHCVPVVADIGVFWPIFASRVCRQLGLELQFLSYPQESPQGQAVREWIVKHVRPLDWAQVLARFEREHERRSGLELESGEA